MEYSEYQNDFEELEKIYESPNKMTVLYKVKEKESKKIFVIKIIKNIEDSFAKVVFRRECDSLKKLNGHKNIVKIYDDFLIIDKNWGCILLEYIDGFNLLDYQLKYDLDNNQKYSIILKILNTVKSAHMRGIIHRDIKPTNVMIDIDNNVKIIDFGTSKIKSIVSTKYNPTIRKFASSGYTAPEVIMGEENTTEESDIYSLGALIYKMFSGNNPEFDWNQFYIQVENEELISSEIKKLILSMIVIKPENRKKIDEVIREFNNLYFDYTNRINNYKIFIGDEDVRQIIWKKILPKNNYFTIRKIGLAEQFKNAYAMIIDKDNISFIGNDIELLCSYNEEYQLFIVKDVKSLNAKLRQEFREYYYKMNGSINFEDSLQYFESTNRQLYIELQDYLVEYKEKNDENKEFSDEIDVWTDIIDEDIEYEKAKVFNFVYKSYSIQNDFYIFKAEDNFCLMDNFECKKNQLLVQEVNKNNKIKTIEVGYYNSMYTENDELILKIKKIKNQKNNVNLARMGIISEDYRAQISPMIKEKQALIELKTVPDCSLRTILMSINQNDIYYTSKKIEYINTKLDPFQREAVKKGITNNYITLIQGPPGTGKTSVITEIVQQIIKENKKSGVSNYKRILLVSKNNKAVDNVLNKLNEIIDKNVIMIRIGREEKITDNIYENYGLDNSIEDWLKNVKEKSINNMKERLNKYGIPYNKIFEYFEITKNNMKKDENESIVKNFENEFYNMENDKIINVFSTFFDWIRDLERTKDITNDYIQSATIIAGTCIGFKSDRIVRDMKFDYVIIDEAATATTPELIVSLLQCSNKVILVGDQKQLEPQISEITRKKLIEEKYKNNKKYYKTIFTKYFEQLQDNRKQILKRQYRMHPIIGTMISQIFYDNIIENGVTDEEKQHELEIYIKKAIVWISTSNCKKRYEKNKDLSYENKLEIEILLKQLKKLDQEKNISGYTIGVITPYSAQRRYLQREVNKLNFNNINKSNIEINTVDAFQGSEKDIIIYSNVRSNKEGKVGFIKQQERVNVMFSRAKRLLIIIGDIEFVNSEQIDNNKFPDIIKYIKKHKEKCLIVDYEVEDEK